MRQHKFLLLFNALTGVEKREFSKFVESSYFNHREDVQRLWNYLIGDFTKSKRGFRKEEAWVAVYPGEPFDEGQFRFPMSWLTKAIEHFLSIRKLEQDEVEVSLRLAEAYREKKLEEPFRQVIQNTEKQLVNQKAEQNFAHKKYRLEYEHFAFLESQKRTKANNLQKVSEALDEYLLSAKLRQSCLLLAHQAVFQTEYDHSFLTAILDFLPGSRFLDKPNIAVYYHGYRALTENDETAFQKFYELLTASPHLFPFEEMGNLWLMALNFCIRRLNTGGPEYVEKAFELYRRGIEEKILLEGKTIGRFTYKNAVALGLRLGKFEWTENFIHTYREHLEKAHRENFFQYNLARLHFSKKEFQPAMSLLVQVDDSDLLLNLDAKVMLLKMYFELGEFDALESHLTAMRTFIRRRKELGYHQKHYLGIIVFTQKLMALPPGDKAAKERLRSEISDSEGISEKDWLLSQI
jgi:hypothetical protein